MRDSTTLFDHDADRDIDGDDELTREFWGASASWVPRDRNHDRAFQLQRGDEPAQALRLDHTPASMRAVREGIAAFRPKRRWRDDSTGSIERTREHGVVPARTAGPATSTRPATTRRRPSPEHLPHRDASIAELAAGQFDAPPRKPGRMPQDADLELESTALIALTPSDDSFGARIGLAGVDPLLVRLGVVLLALLLAIPLALSLRDDGNGSVGTTSVTVAPAGAAVGIGGAVVDAITPAESLEDAAASNPPTAPLSTAAAQASDDGSVAATAEAVAAPAATSPDSTSTDADAATDPAASDSGSSNTDDTTRAAPLTESEDPAVSDDAATVSETAERAIPDCSLSYTAGAGDSWYRIADAAGVTPTALLEQNRATTDTVIFPGDEVCLPQGATVPSTPATTAAPTTTQTPTTTAAPTTTTAPPAPVSTAEVQALIREIWPDELEERALEIAWRESGYRADADNGWCCVGVFQLYWTVHRGWLDDYGITTRNDLKDARKNITAAYALYQRSGGWGPWSTA